MKIRVIPKGKRYIMLRKGIGFVQAERDGGLVLNTETSWRKISGIWINTDHGCYWIYFRRSSLL